MVYAGLQLRLWCPKFREFRTLEIVSFWEGTGLDDHDPTGWEVFWHGDVESTSFDLAGREVNGERHMHDLFHEVGCVAPSTFVSDLQGAYEDKHGEQVATLINEITRLRTEQFGAVA